MAILKSRPRVRVSVPNEIRPGDTFLAKVILDCKRAVPVESVNVHLEGKERWSVSSGNNSSVSRSNTFLALGSLISGARELPKGRTELAVRIPLPANVPPTYRGAAATIGYTLTVRAEIAWWPDRKASFDIFVAPPPANSLPDEPQVYASNPAGPTRSEAHAEISVASSWTRVNDVVSGALALSNVAHNRYSEVTVGLRGVETIYYENGRKRSDREYMRYQIRIGAEQAREGEMIPFRFRLPKEAMCDLPLTHRPNGRWGLCSLAWQLEVVVGIRWAQDLVLRMPFSVLPASPRHGDAPSRIAPPTVGSDRLREIWEGAGTEYGLRYQSQTLYGSVGGTTLAIRRDMMGRDGVFITAELSYADLCLDLEVEPASKLQKVVGGGALVGDRAWDREHYVRARDEKQVESLLRAIVPALKNATLRRMDDERLTIAVRDGGTTRSRMKAFVGASTHLAQAFERIRAQLPPPPAMSEAVPVWRELAARLGTDLETARMRIEGQLGSLAAEVRLAFDTDGQPLSTWLSVTPSMPIDAEHTLRVVAADDALARIEACFDGEVLDLVKVVSQGAHEFAIEPGRVAVCLPLLLGVSQSEPPEEIATLRWRDGNPPFDTAAAAEQRLSRLARLITLLRGQAGPYR